MGIRMQVGGYLRHLWGRTNELLYSWMGRLEKRYDADGCMNDGKWHDEFDLLWLDVRFIGHGRWNLIWY